MPWWRRLRSRSELTSHQRRHAVPEILPSVPAPGLTRALFLLILLLMVGALVYAAWIAITNAGQIGV